MKINQNFRRTFYHELGHYIAHYFNFKNFGISNVERIELKEVLTRYGIDFNGETILLKPEGHNINNDKVVNLPEKIVELVYGCYFQSLYLEYDFNCCFDFERNGESDLQYMNGGLIEYGIDRNSNIYKILFELLNQQYLNLKLSNIFRDLKLLKIEELIIKSTNSYIFDLSKINKVLSVFLIKHESTYLQFLDKIKETINWIYLKRTDRK